MDNDTLVAQLEAWVAEAQILMDAPGAVSVAPYALGRHDAYKLILQLVR